MSDIKRICVWSGPRNISTALMYSFAQRSDTSVVDEPLYAHFLANTDAREYHPGADEVLKTQENDGQKVIEEVILGEYKTPVVFFKQMTHHLVNLDWSFMRECTHVLLTRDPVDMLPSFAQQIHRPSMRDIGYAQHLELLEFLNGLGQSPPIVDSKWILCDPETTLSALCGAINIPFEPAMLSWKPGPRPEDGCWARYWYENVHKSSGFKPYQPKTEPFPPHLEGLLAESRPMYEALLASAKEVTPPTPNGHWLY